MLHKIWQGRTLDMSDWYRLDFQWRVKINIALLWKVVDKHAPFFSPVNGTISSRSLYSMASFSRYLRSPSLLNGPVSVLDVWSFWRKPAGSRAFWGEEFITLIWCHWTVGLILHLQKCINATVWTFLKWYRAKELQDVADCFTIN